MKRRMIAEHIVSEGRFLRMSLSAQGLYMHLVAHTDDDGIVDAYTIMRMVGAKEDDLVLLKERAYITVLDEQEWILWITGFQEFNWIDPRYKEDSKYLPLLRAKVEGIEIVQSTRIEYNKERWQRQKEKNQLEQLTAHVQHMGSTGDALVTTPLRIGKDRIGENNTPLPPLQGEVEKIDETHLNSWQQVMGNPIRKDKPANARAAQKILKEVGSERFHELLMAARMIRADKFQKRKIQSELTNFIGLEKNIENVEAFIASQIDQKRITNQILEAS